MSETQPPALAGYPVVLKLPVQWGDQDAFGHVNNVVYFRWCESGRIAYLAETGLETLLTAAGQGPILASIKCDYRRQINFPDTVRIGTRVTRIGTKSVSVEHAIYSDALGGVAATAESVVVIYNYSQHQSCPVSDEVRKRIGEVEGLAKP